MGVAFPFMLVGLFLTALMGFIAPNLLFKIIFTGSALIFYFTGLLSYLTDPHVLRRTKLAVAISTSIILSLILFMSFVLIPTYRGMRAEYLLTRGEKVATKYFNVEINFSLKVNNRHPYQIRSVWNDPRTGKTRVFKSENLWFNPERFVPNTIYVYIDPDNPSNYMMDLSFLKNLAD